MTMTIKEIQEEIINEFKIFDNWMDKYNNLIKIGKNLPSIDSKYKIEENLIKDCKVKSWLYSTFKDGKIFYEIESESLIVKGTGALLIRILSGQTPKDIKNANLYFIDAVCDQKPKDLQNLINRMKSIAITYEVRKSKNKMQTRLL